MSRSPNERHYLHLGELIADLLGRISEMQETIDGHTTDLIILGGQSKIDEVRLDDLSTRLAAVESKTVPTTGEDPIARLASMVADIAEALIDEPEPTRPTEPPPGSVVRKVSTGEVGVRDKDPDAPWEVTNPTHRNEAGSFSWDAWIEPGDEIELAAWVTT